MELLTASVSCIETPSLFSESELKVLNNRIAANADKWLGEKVQKNKDASKVKNPLQQKSNIGRKSAVVMNPFSEFIGPTTYWERYPAFAMDIIEGIARLDWHDRPIGVGGKSMPLSVRRIVDILERLPIVTNDAVKALLDLEKKHAGRYVKSIKLIVPHMMKSRPISLYNEMEGIELEPSPSTWKDSEEIIAPSPEALAKLHYDLRTLTRYKSAEGYEAEYEAELSGSSTGNVIAFPARKQHPKKAQALALLEDGMGVRAIARELEVSVNSVRSWKDSLRIDQQAA